MLMRRAMEEGKLTVYRFDMEEDMFTHLQYANDTLIIREKKWSNIIIIKVNLLLFEVISGL